MKDDGLMQFQAGELCPWPRMDNFESDLRWLLNGMIPFKAEPWPRFDWRFW